jgi:ribosomal protein L21E
MKRSAADAHTAMLIALANEHPQLRAELMPLIQDQTQPASVRLAATVKKAFSEESEQFVAWCIMKGDKWDKNECQRALDKLGVPMQEEGVVQTRGPLEKGEMVECKAAKNTNAKNTDVCEQFDGKTGHVVDIDGDALIIDFTDGVRNFGKGRFEGKQSGATTGLYRYTPSVAGGADTRAMVEVVYISDKTAKPPTKERIEQIQEYVDKGTAAGESRSRIYYSGNPLKQAMGKNGYYFTVFSAQRDQYPTSINPAKGEVLYIGRMGGRPGGWKNEFAKMVEESTAKGE